METQGTHTLGCGYGLKCQCRETKENAQHTPGPWRVDYSMVDHMRAEGRIWGNTGAGPCAGGLSLVDRIGMGRKEANGDLSG